MAIRMIERTWCGLVDDFRCSYLMDSAADVADLPKSCVGSMAMVADKDGAVFVVNPSGEWKEV